MELRNRSNTTADQHGSRSVSPPSSAKTSRSPVNLASLFTFLLAFRVVSAFRMQTFFQPDEHYQTTEIAHRIVFGYGFRSWEWSSSGDSSILTNCSYLSAALRNLLDGPVRSILHPLLFVPGYSLLKLSGLDQTSLLVLFPRIQQAVIAAIGDYFTFQLAYRIGGPVVAWLATLVNLSNLYTLFTATRTFSNTTEAALTAAALFYWPYVPFFSSRFDVPTFSTAEERAQLRALQNPGCAWQQMAPKDNRPDWDEQTEYDRDLDQKQVSRLVYDRTLRTSVLLAAVACLLRPTSGVLWVYLSVELFARQIQCLGKSSLSRSSKKQGNAVGIAEDQEGSVLPLLELVGEAGSFVNILLTTGLAALGLALAVDTTYDYLENQSPAGGRLLPALSLLSFLHKNVVSNLSIFYGANPWHFYLTQGLPVLCTAWLPATLFGLIRTLQPSPSAVQQRSLGDSAKRSLAKLVCVTVALYSLLGHKEFRFLQPLLPALAILAANGLAESYASHSQAAIALTQQASPLKQLWRSLNLLPFWLRAVLLTVQPMAAMYLNTVHAVAQEQVPYELGKLYRQQQLKPPADPVEFGLDFGRIHNLGFLMPCHSTPWATHLHNKELVERSWFIECPPPLSRSRMTPAQRETPYWDQSDFFYHDPIRYLVDRFPYNVNTDYPPAPKHERAERQNAWDEGWRHSWPSHLVVFESLLKEGTRKVGHTRTLKNLLSLKGYREVGRYWNTPKHEDARREGDIVVLAYKGPKSDR